MHLSHIAQAVCMFLAIEKNELQIKVSRLGYWMSTILAALSRVTEIAVFENVLWCCAHD